MKPDYVIAEIPVYANELEFDYLNHRGIRYTYVITPESLQFGWWHPDGGGIVPERRRGECTPLWVLSGDVITRDGDKRPDMGTRRRTFVFDKIQHPRNPHS